MHYFHNPVVIKTHTHKKKKSKGAVSCSLSNENLDREGRRQQYNNALLVIGALKQKQVTRSLFQKVLWVLVPVSGESCAFWCLETALGLFSASYIYCIC